jgi:hypothetical protein
MIIVLQEQKSSDTVVFSSVTSFDESYSGKITEHPVENDSKITDHFVKDSEKFRISGIVSDYDFLNPNKTTAQTIEGYDNVFLRSATTAKFENGVLTTYGVVIPAQLTMEAVKAKLYSIQRSGSMCTILMYSDTNNIINYKLNCVMTSLSFKEDENTGYAIYPEMTFEQITVVKLAVEQVEKGKIPKINTNLKDAVATKLAKGKGDDCLPQTEKTVVNGVVTETTTIAKPKLPKGETAKPACKPTEADDKALKSLGWLAQQGYKISTVEELNEQLIAKVNALTAATEAGNKPLRAQLRQEIDYLETLKDYVKL